MTTRPQTTAVGVFTDKAQADRALEALHNAGFTDDQIGFIRRDLRDTEAGRAGTDLTETEATTEEKSAAAATGAVGGGILGGLLGAAAALVIPGIGPAVAGGILVTTLGGVAIGAVAGGLIGALTNMGIPEEEARYYQQELAAGRTLLTVNAGNRYNEAVTLLRSHGAYDVYTQPGTQQPITNTYDTRTDDETRYAPSAQTTYDNQTYPAHHIEQPAEAVGAGTENYRNDTYPRENENFQQGTSQTYREDEYRRNANADYNTPAYQQDNTAYRQSQEYRDAGDTNIAPETYQRGVDTSNQTYTENTNAPASTSPGMYNKDMPPTQQGQYAQSTRPEDYNQNMPQQALSSNQETYRTDAGPTADPYSTDQAYSDSNMPPRENYPYQERPDVTEPNTRPVENQPQAQPSRHELRPDEMHKGNTPPPPDYQR